MTHDAARPNVTAGTQALARALCGANVGHYRGWDADLSHATVDQDHEPEAAAIITALSTDDAIALAAELLATHQERLAEALPQDVSRWDEPEFVEALIAALRAKP